jgi:hypothetical protein
MLQCDCCIAETMPAVIGLQSCGATFDIAANAKRSPWIDPDGTNSRERGCRVLFGPKMYWLWLLSPIGTGGVQEQETEL